MCIGVILRLLLLFLLSFDYLGLLLRSSTQSLKPWKHFFFLIQYSFCNFFATFLLNFLLFYNYKNNKVEKAANRMYWMRKKRYIGFHLIWGCCCCSSTWGCCWGPPPWCSGCCCWSSTWGCPSPWSPGCCWSSTWDCRRDPQPWPPGCCCCCWSSTWDCS